MDGSVAIWVAEVMQTGTTGSWTVPCAVLHIVIGKAGLYASNEQLESKSLRITLRQSTPIGPLKGVVSVECRDKIFCSFR